MGFIKRAFEFLSRPTQSRTMGLVVVLILVVAVSLTVIASQQQQQTKQRASAVCEDTSIQECPSKIATDGNDCFVNPKFQCRIGNKIYGCK